MNERYNYDCDNVEWKSDDDDRTKWYGGSYSLHRKFSFSNSRSSSTPPSYFSPFRHGSRDRVSCTENVSEKGTTIKWNKYLSPPPRFYSVYMPSFTTPTASLTDLYIQLKLYEECILILQYVLLLRLLRLSRLIHL